MGYNDSPDDKYYIRNGEIHRPKAQPRASLAALQWAADKAGTSYGMFTQNLSPEEETKIQLEYQEFRRKRKAAMQAEIEQRAEENAARRSEKDTVSVCAIAAGGDYTLALARV